jgi:16S rRNA (adenine1518-N6/adenine1519-N6)-dimethyltransferase
VIGNLPYNISTPLIFHLLAQADAISDMTFMLQKEVVERLTASPGTRDWGRLSIMVQYHCQADYLFFVPPEAFSPPPRVDSAVVRLIPHDSPPHPADDEDHLRKLVAQAFTQRRKAIRNGLKSWVSAEQFQALGIDAGLRPDQLSVADYVALANISRPPADVEDANAPHTEQGKGDNSQ